MRTQERSDERLSVSPSPSRETDLGHDWTRPYVPSFGYVPGAGVQGTWPPRPGEAARLRGGGAVWAHV